MSTRDEQTVRRPTARRRWPLKTLIEILPIVIALTVFFSYATVKRVSKVALITPPAEVFGQVPLWTVWLMGLIFGVGLLGMGWLIYLFSRAPILPAGDSPEEPAAAVDSSGEKEQRRAWKDG